MSEYKYHGAIQYRSIVLCLILEVLLFSCNGNKQVTDYEMPPLYPSPITVKLNTDKGYTFNQVTGDSINSVRNSFGDELITGVPVPVRGKVIDPSIPAKALVIHVDEPKAIPGFKTSPKKTIDPKVFVVNKDSLRKFIPGNDTSSFVLVNSSGDTIPTGIPVTVKGKVGTYSHPQSVRALPPRIKENALTNLKYLDVTLGMNGSTVIDIFEDSRGNLWFGTGRGGATMYDGNMFTHFTLTEGLKSNLVRSIFEDSQGNIWFGTQHKGVTKYDGNTFTHFAEEEGLGGNLVNSIIEDKKGRLWFGTNPGGAVMYDGKTFTHYTVREGLSYHDRRFIANRVHSIFEDRKDNLWFGAIGGGLSMYDGNSFFHFFSQKGNLPGAFVWTILEDSEENLWFGSNEGVSRFDGDTLTHFTVEEGLSSNQVRSMVEDRQGNLWFTTWAGGVNKFDGQHFTHLTEEEGLTNNNVWSIHEDTHGNLWFGTIAGGVNVYQVESFQHFTTRDGLTSNYITSIREDNFGCLWFNGVILKTGDVFTDFSEYFLKSQVQGDVYSDFAKTVLNIQNLDKVPADFAEHFLKSQFALEDSKGNLWNLLHGPGLSRYDGESVTVYYKDDGLPGDGYVNRLIEDSKGNLWMTTEQDDGVCMYDGVTFTHFTEKEGLSSNIINAIMEDSQGNLWFATEGRGVSKYDGTNFTHFTEKEGLSNNYVRSVIEDSQGNLWFGTMIGGVSIYNGESFTYITQREGLSHNEISSIVEDNDHRVWVGTGKGLNCIVLNSDNTEGAGFHTRLVIYVFSEQDGLIGMDFSQHPALLDSKNRIWWGTNKDLCMLDLNSFKLPVAPPSKIKLTRLDINGQFIDYRQLPDSVASNMDFDLVVRFQNYPLNLKLPFKYNHLTFHYSAIDWAAPHKIRYSYIIDGLDKSWSNPSSEPKADYRNLPHGTHTFQIRAIGASQKWSEPFEYTFNILPPWWFRWWAYIIYAFILISILLQYRRYLLKRAQLRSKVELERIEKEKVLEMDHMKSRFFANISHEFRTPLTLILGPVEDLLKKKSSDVILKKEELGIIRRNAIRLQELINQILDISKLETGKIKLQVSEGNLTEFVRRIVLSFLSLAESKGITYDYDLADTAGPVFFDADKLEKIITNLVSNAFKFTSPGGEIKVSAHYEVPEGFEAPEYVEISIKDSGKGINPDQIEKIFDRFYQVGSSDTREHEGTGIGLALSKELVDLCRGKISVESEPGKGSVFTVVIPVSKNHFNSDEFIPSSVISETDGITQHPADFPDASSRDIETDHVQAIANESEQPVVLIVEDNVDLRLYISSNLNDEYQILEAENGRTGLERAIEEIPDLVITDLMMPEMDGLELCNLIRRDNRTDHIPIVMLTAKADMESKLEGLSTGADDYLIKPFDTDELRVRVNNLIQQRRSLRKKYLEEFYNNDPLTKKIPDLEDDFLIRVVDCINRNLDDNDFSVEQLGGEIGFSRSQLYRKVLALTGFVPNEFIRNIRLKQAARMFQEGHTNITRVMYTVGFSSPSYFANQFRDFFGMNPSEYLKQKEGSSD